MRSRFFTVLVLMGTLLPALIPGPAVGIYAQTEVDRAADEVATAAAQRAEALRQVEEWAARRGTVQDRVVAALFALEQTNSSLEQAAYRALDLHDQILEAEARIRQMREVTEARVVETYMAGTANGLFSIWAASTFEQSALLEETAASAKRADLEELANLGAERENLANLRDGYHQSRDSLAVLREARLDQTKKVEGLLVEVDAQYALSYAGLSDADAVYQDALADWETAQRRRAARVGVEPWRPLVEQYFGAAFVDEALDVMRCESGGNPDALHPESEATGLFQFLAGTWAFSSVNAGFAGASRFDAEANIAAAAWLVSYSIRTEHPGGAWGHWVCQP